MIYSEQELRRWWDSLSNSAKAELFLECFEKAYTQTGRMMSMSLRKQWSEGKIPFTEKQLAALRKWYHA